MTRFTYRVWTIFLASTVVLAGRRPRFEPLPECSECVPRSDILAYGIGIDLTPSYGTAAIRYNDGSVVNLGKIDATLDYMELMSRLMNSSRKARCDEDVWHEIDCFRDKVKRNFNKARGLPATADVGILSSLIFQLRATIDDKLGKGTVKSVLPILPRLPGLSSEDLKDAVEYAGIRMLYTHKHVANIVSETSAAFAGMGSGLCEHYDNCDTCEDEEADMRYAHILSVSFDRTYFSATYEWMQSAFQSLPEKDTIRADLGLESLPSSEEDQKLFWNEIQAIIVDVGRASQVPLTDVLLLGEDAGNPVFIRTLQDALRELVPHSSTDIRVSFGEQDSSLDPLYIAARGAAEFAKRALGAPAGCKEPPRCAKNRVPPGSYSSDQVVLNTEL